MAGNAEGWERRAGSSSAENPGGETGHLDPLRINKAMWFILRETLSVCWLCISAFVKIVLFKYIVGAEVVDSQQSAHRASLRTWVLSQDPRKNQSRVTAI